MDGARSLRWREIAGYAAGAQPGSFDACGGRVEFGRYQGSLDRLLQDIDAALLRAPLHRDDATGRLAARRSSGQLSAGSLPCSWIAWAARRTRNLPPLAASVSSSLLPLRLLRQGRSPDRATTADRGDGRIGQAQNIVDAGANRGMSNEELVARVVRPVVLPTGGSAARGPCPGSR
jgi:hypothetical protein